MRAYTTVMMGIVLLAMVSLAAEQGIKKAIVKKVTTTDGKIRTGLVVLEKTGDLSSQVRGFMPGELIDFVKENPTMAGLVAEIVEVPKDQLHDTLNALPKEEGVYLYFNNVGKLGQLAGQLNKRAAGFNEKLQVYGDKKEEPAALDSTEAAPPTEMKAEDEATAKKSDLDKMMSAIRRDGDRKHINRATLAELMNRKQTDLSGNAAKESDIASLYDALALIMADDRCGFESMKSKQEYLTKGIDLHVKPIDIDSSSNDIGGGRITVSRKQTEGAKDLKPITLTWDANHFTKMDVESWLYGSKSGPSNGHIGFYKQLAMQNLCGLGGMPGEWRSDRKDASEAPVHK